MAYHEFAVAVEYPHSPITKIGYEVDGGNRHVKLWLSPSIDREAAHKEITELLSFYRVPNVVPGAINGGTVTIRMNKDADFWQVATCLINCTVGRAQTKSNEATGMTTFSHLLNVAEEGRAMNVFFNKVLVRKGTVFTDDNGGTSLKIPDEVFNKALAATPSSRTR